MSAGDGDDVAVVRAIYRAFEERRSPGEVVARIRGSYRLSADGEPLEAARYTHIWTVRDGKAVRARVDG